MSFQFAPSTATRPSADVQRVNSAPVEKFFLCSHPSRWALFGDRLLPILDRMKIKPGVNGVDHRGDYGLSMLQRQREGWTVIPWDAVACHANGREYPEYIATYEGKNGPIHQLIWSTPNQLNSTAAATWATDSVGYRRFLGDLVDNGIIPPPDPNLLTHLIERAQAEIDRMTPRAVNSASIKRRLENHTSQLGKLLALRDGDPKPKRRRNQKNG